MKIRETINNNADKYKAVTFEDAGKIIVVKQDTYNYYDSSTNNYFEFNTISQYENWKAEQDWINKKKIKKVSAFRKVV